MGALGSISLEEYPGAQRLPDYDKIRFNPQPATPWQQLLPGGSPHAVGLLARLLVYNPDTRPTARDALLDDFFFRPPSPPAQGCLSILSPASQGHRRQHQPPRMTRDAAKAAITNFGVGGHVPCTPFS